ncbi:MAG: hypothetical protein NW214_04110 [Pseudanabaenaceae cyanobacterium bins.39]|nr:hypothetical protein [Pseudanabaenaceae cyanobacterium bins.39]
MRGAGRAAGKLFTPRRTTKAPEPNSEFGIGLNPFVPDLPVAPKLEPINDEWSISPLFDWEASVDPRDCSKYPASPYCENDLIRFGPPVGFDVEFRSNGCTTCMYVYPVVGWMRLTPTIVCKTDPACEERRRDPPPRLNKDPLRRFRPFPRMDEDPPVDSYRSPECANREKWIAVWHNSQNREESKKLDNALKSFETTDYRNVGFFVEELQSGGNTFDNADCLLDLSQPYPIGYPQATGEFVYRTRADLLAEYAIFAKGERKIDPDNPLSGWIEFSGSVASFRYVTFGKCCGMDNRPSIKPPPPPPPPRRRDDDDEDDDDMCCNECRDAKENTDNLLAEIRKIQKVIGSGQLENSLAAATGRGSDITAILNAACKAIGINRYPIEVPETLIAGLGDKVIKANSNAEFLAWLTYQIDALVGQFPIEIEVKDIDPLKEGDQKKSISLPNVAEAIAEIYGLTIKNAVNQEVELNMLLRLAAEAIATKNAAIVTQDYARANAQYLGYRGNFKARELDYNFDFAGANLDPKSKDPIVLEKLLKTVKGYVQGWQNEDQETVVGFLQKLMFSAGIIKAVFFRGKGQQKELQREIQSMTKDEQAQQDRFEAFIKEINDPNSRFNRETGDKPEIKDETPPDKPKGAK